MPYTHGFHPRFDRLVVVHSHEDIRPSGLVIPTHLAMSDIKVIPHSIPEGIVVASSSGEFDEASGWITTAVPELTITTPDMIDSIDKVKQAVRRIGKVASLRFGVFLPAYDQQSDIPEAHSLREFSRLLEAALEPNGRVSSDSTNHGTGLYL